MARLESSERGFLIVSVLLNFKTLQEKKIVFMEMSWRDELRSAISCSRKIDFTHK